jgi:outer membrane protein assembly factor BamB
MQKSANRFIELLEERQLLPAEVIAELRRQVSDSGVNLPPELLARLLVENGHLTKFQASKLISEMSVKAGESARPTPQTEIGLAPSRDTANAILESPSPSTFDAIAIVEDAVPVVRAESTPASPSPKSRSPKTKSESQPKPTPPPVMPGSQSGTGIQSGTGSAPPAAAARSRVAETASVLPAEIPKVVRSKSSKENPWDSFRILGIGVLLGLVCVVGFFLVRSMIRGNAEDAIKFADNAYQQRSYEDAANAYRSFTSSWPTHEKSSYAKVRSVLAAFRKDSETAPNPAIGLRTAEELLPSIREESALPEQQGDLAGALVALAEKFVSRMDATKGTDERKLQMSEMDRLMQLIGDPQFVGSTQRTQLSPTLQRIDESKARLKREIQRDDELKATLAEIDQQLEAKQVVQAYEARRKLVSRYPLLETHPDLNQRVLQASTIQKNLVKDDPLTLDVRTPDSDSGLQSLVLTHRTGADVPDLNGTIIAYSVKGAVFGLDAVSGRVLWKKWVGRGVAWPPIRLQDAPAADLLVVQSELGRVEYLNGTTGLTQWQADFGEWINPPTVRDEDILITSKSGLVACLDAPSGQTKWVKRLPQSISVGPGVSQNGQVLYQPADHSNIYVLNRRDGSCADVFYLGHREGSVQVAPVFVLGHLVLAESVNVDSSRIRVLAADETGLQVAQPPIPVDGNVVLPPSVEGRQILVQSNLGNSIVLDVEPSAASQRVTVTARVPKNLDAPQSIWTAFSRNQIWLAENRLARFDLVVTQGKLNRRWIQHEGDEFVGPLHLVDQTLFHVRRPQGNLGVRVSAAAAETGNPAWQVDLGSPISLLARTPDQQIDAITSNGALFALNGETLRSQADANPGESKSLKLFAEPVWLDSNRAVLLNRANPREFALYSSANPNRLRVLTVPLGSASPSCGLVASDKHCLAGLDNGSLVMFDPETGVLVGAPYQATAMRPGAKVQWNQPVFLPDSQMLIAASDVGQMVRLSVGDSLRALSEVPLKYPLVGPLSACGNQIVAVHSTDSGPAWAVFDAQSLQVTSQHPLDSPLLTGPYGTAQGGFLQTEKSLVAWDAQGQPSWELQLPTSPLVGPPVMAENTCWIANRLGQLWIVDSRNGQVIASQDLGQPISTPPLLLGKKVLLGTDDGSVLVMDIPTETTLTERE